MKGERGARERPTAIARGRPASRWRAYHPPAGAHGHALVAPPPPTTTAQ